MRFPLLLSLLASLALTSGAFAQTPKSGGVSTFGVAAEPPTYDCHGGSLATEFRRLTVSIR